MRVPSSLTASLTVAEAFTGILPAAGFGSRMGEICRSRSKTLLELSSGTPILECALRSILDAEVCGRIVLAIRPDDEAAIRSLCEKLSASIPIDTVIGGATRQESVAAALKAVAPDVSYVLVHDAARPFCSAERIQAVCKAAIEHGAAILALPVKPTLKEASEAGEIVRTVSRKMMWEAQTPQAFLRSVLDEAHEQALADGFQGTDESELVERLGAVVKIVLGDERNVKITSPEDLRVAEALL